MYFFADKFMNDVLMGCIKDFDDEMYWIYFTFKIFLCFLQSISETLINFKRDPGFSKQAYNF